MTSQLMKSNNDININEELLEKVILNNDLSGLTSLEKVQHVKNVCLSLGLNPLTKPIQLHKFQGKEVMYMAKDGAEQIRKIHNVSIVKLDTDILRNDLYVVKAYAQLPNGRQDCSTAALSICGLKGDAIGNAMKKCETQAKRRVTLSICGLGMLSEEELENLPKENESNRKNIFKSLSLDDKESNKNNLEIDLDEILLNISQCSSSDELKEIISSYRHIKTYLDEDSIEKIKEAKNEKQKYFNSLGESKRFLDKNIIFDEKTGEIKE